MAEGSAISESHNLSDMVGKSLSHAFRFYVLDDVKMIELGRAASEIENELDRIFTDGYVDDFYTYWPVKYENFNHLGNRRNYIVFENNRSLLSNNDDESLIAAFDHLDKLVLSFVTLLRERKVILSGYKPDDFSNLIEIPAFLWEDPDIYVDYMSNELVRNPGARQTELFKGISVKTWFGITAKVDEEEGYKIGKIGPDVRKDRRTKHDWDAVVRVLLEMALHPDGLPTGKNKLVSKVREKI